jgi:hypothetical protein
MTGKRSVEVMEIPVHLVPVVIAEKVREVGNRVFRITVKRSHWHHYNISVRTKMFWKELSYKQVVPEVAAAEIGKRSRRCRGTAS